MFKYVRFNRVCYICKGYVWKCYNFVNGIFVKWCSHNEVQSNSKVYSSFASIYINPVVYSLLIKVAWGASVWVAYINLLISGAKVKGRNYFTKVFWVIHKNISVVIIIIISKKL
jgi:hypothetical protein